MSERKLLECLDHMTMNNKYTEKERLLRVLSGKLVDRPPVICPGGMMNGAVTEVIESLTENHNVDLKAMITAAKLVYDQTGFENYGVPFCMTAESEPLGIEVHFGDKYIEPRVTKYSKLPMEAVVKLEAICPQKEPRMKTVIDAIEQLANEDVPVIGNITGHMSTASSIVDPNIVFKYLLKKPDLSMEFMSYVNDYLIDYAIEMIKAGADVIAISDPTATGEILGKRIFEKYAVPFYQDFVNAIKPYGIPVIFHMCGNAKNVLESIDKAGFNALSFDSIVNMKQAKEVITTQLMGNVNTQSLNFGTLEKIEALTKVCLDSGVDIVSPACGLGMSTSIRQIKSMTQYVKEGYSHV